MIKKIATAALISLFSLSTVFAATTTYIEAAISTDEGLQLKKSSVFDASESFIPNLDREVSYEWDFGDGNKNEGVQILHAYQEPGRYTVNLNVSDGISSSETSKDVFAYRKLIVLITDQTEAEDRIQNIKQFAESEGVFIEVIESFGSATDFISEEILTKKLNEEAKNIRKAGDIMVWTNANSGINALSRSIQNGKSSKINFSQKTITSITDNPSAYTSRTERQFDLIKPKNIILAKEGAIDILIESINDQEFINTLEEKAYPHEIITSRTGKLRPWNFMSFFVNSLINNGVPDNTIALLLLLPLIATVVAFMKQVVGITTFGIYTPSIITLSFFIIGIYAGLITLAVAITVGALVRPILKKLRMLFIPKMAIVITLVSLSLLFVLIISNAIGLFDSEFLSIAIFPMLILSTLVEKFVSAKSEKGLSSAAVLMTETVIVAIIAYFIAGGEINLGLFSLHFEFIRNLILTYPETILLLLGINVALGKWSGLRIMERLRFREVLRHIEE